MTTQEQQKLVNNAKRKLTQALVNLNKSFTSSELTYMGVILENELKTIFTICSTDLPLASPQRFKLHCNNGSVGGYHPINGLWYQIYQITGKDGKLKYYTNGILETKNLDSGEELEPINQVD
jgi:hypothetical protein